MRQSSFSRIPPWRYHCAIQKGELMGDSDSEQLISNTPNVLIHCDGCGHPSLLHAGMLQKPFSDPEESPNDTSAIGFACPHCKSLRRYFLHPQKQGQSRTGPGPAWASAPRNEETVLVGMLECEVESCEFLLPLFALWSDSTNDEERLADIETWQWENLRCPEEHVIRKPSD